ncbi:hypothetical protein FB451DRAFT_630185 [Mycena latifolia]|nr:hypothetical protein FB451DRAFT_630185 [Mycena latifolia]
MFICRLLFLRIQPATYLRTRHNTPSSKGPSPCQKFYDLLVASPHLAPYVRSLEIFESLKMIPWRPEAIQRAQSAGFYPTSIAFAAHLDSFVPTQGRDAIQADTASLPYERAFQATENPPPRCLSIFDPHFAQPWKDCINPIRFLFRVGELQRSERTVCIRFHNPDI